VYSGLSTGTAAGTGTRDDAPWLGVIQALLTGEPIRQSPDTFFDRDIEYLEIASKAPSNICAETPSR
jgi:hypothetical protein